MGSGTADLSTVPRALLHNLKHNKVLHRQNAAAPIVFREMPWVSAEDRVKVEQLGPHFWRIRIEFGLVETPDAPPAMALARAQGLEVSPFKTTRFLSRRTVVPASGGGMVQWREKLLTAMSRNASGVAAFF